MKQNIQSRVKSFTKFVARAAKKTGAWLNGNGANLGFVVGFTICLVGAFWAAASAPLPVAVAVIAVAGLVSLAETV